MSENSPSNGAAATGPFMPLLTTYDWNEEWKALQRSRRAADDASYWDKRSATFGTKDAPNPYVDRFLELAAIRPGETVFDMGCGTGALTVPLARAGHRVVAADFSGGMLGVLRGLLDEAGVPYCDEDAPGTRERGAAGDERAAAGAEADAGLPAQDANAGFARLIQMSWEDDWAARGVGPDSVDVALASRSIATADMRDSLLRLTDVARRRACITLSTGSSPRADEALLAELGIAGRAGRDYLYAFNILAGEGFSPEVAYITSMRDDTFATWDDAWASFTRMVDGALRVEPSGEAGAEEERERAEAYERLRAWLDDNLLPNPDAGKPDRKGVPQGALKTRRPRTISWAFIAWEK